ncbi:MAG: cytochrome C [Burkholderiaceae bacterium]|nr:cytochrome C [Burkholderiaceae bacterium]
MNVLRIASAAIAAAIVCCAHAAEQPPSRTLATTCTGCHGTHGRSTGAMPSIASLPRKQLAEQMRAFRDGRRDATVMQQIANGYSDAQIDALAEHFARQQRGAAR